MLVKTYRLRLYLIYIVPVLAMLGLASRLYYLQVIDQKRYQDLATAQHFDEYDIVPMRGKIFDANGHELAGSIILDRAHANIHHIPGYKSGFSGSGEIISELASTLAKVLNDPNMTYDDLVRRLSGKVNQWPYLGRDITETKKLEIRKALTEVKTEGISPRLIDFVPENKRRYSRGGLAPHVVGFTQRDETGDNKGVYGVELTYNEELRGREETYTARKSATGNPMEPADPDLLESTFGHSIKLTIDESIQAVTQDVLTQGVEKTKADGGVAICYHVKTGEVLSMASYPSFELTNIAGALPEQRTNRALSHAIEPGSVMKIITFTSLFDDDKIEPFDTIDCEGGDWVVPGTSRVIHDSSRQGVIPVSKIFQKSSNIGTIKAARAFDYDTFYNHLTRFGFGKRTGIDLPGESPGVLHPVKNWRPSSMVSLPMGYELQLTAIQVVAAVGAIANNGIYMQPHVVKEIMDHTGATVKKIEPKPLRSVANPVACRKIVELMEMVVQKGGTATAASLDGYRVGGKTGTTKKLNPDTGQYYESAYIASFCGIAPIEDPEVCIYVYVDWPKGDKTYGGQVAAPIFREIAREAMRVLRIPEQTKKMPAEDFRMTLDRVRNKIEGRVPKELVSGNHGDDAADQPSLDTVPDVLHMSLREALKVAGSVGMEVRVDGSGIVVEQDPPPNETIEGERVMRLTLASSEQYVKRQVDEYEKWMGLEEADQVNASIGFAQPVTSVSLSLEAGGERIPVSLKPTESTALASPNVKALERKEAEEEPEDLPDLDPVANQPIDTQASRQSWSRFEKELKNLKEKHGEEAILAEPEERHETETTGPNLFPVPDIDRTDELNPEGEISPVQIETPVKSDEEENFKGASWYDLQ